MKKNIGNIFLLSILGLILLGCSGGGRRSFWWDRSHQAAMARYVVVRRGESLGDIAARAHQDVRKLAWYNGLVAPYTLQVGQRLYLVMPQASSSPVASSRSPALRPEPANLLHAQDWRNPMEGAPVSTRALPTPKVHKKKHASSHAASSKKSTRAPHVKKKAHATIVKKHGGAASSLGHTSHEAHAPHSAHPAALPKKKVSLCFVLPLHELSLGSKRVHRLHSGAISIDAMIGQRIYAAASGRVIYVGSGVKGLDRLIILMHAHNVKTIYAFVKDVRVHLNEHVHRGSVIAYVAKRKGATRLHFEIRDGLKNVNALHWLRTKKCS